MGGCCGVSSARSCPGSSSWSGVLVVMRRAWVDDDEMWSPSGTFPGVGGL